MGYESITQTDVDPPKDDPFRTEVASDGSLSPSIPHLPLAPFSLSFDEPSGDAALTDPAARTGSRDSKVSKILSTLTGTTTKPYDLVEDDEYEESQPVDDLPVRTASVSRQLPLNHPRPDLQSLQGAYVKNVERLEENAERLSVTSSLEERQSKGGWNRIQQDAATSVSAQDLHTSKLPQMPGLSWANSILDVNAMARSGGYSPAGYVASPNSSARDAHSTRATASDKVTLRSSMSGTAKTPLSMADVSGMGKGVRFDPNTTPQLPEVDTIASRAASNASPERPGSAGSGDTYQQARTLFTDFDGVHYSDTTADRMSRRISLSHPPRARDSRAFREPQPGEEMIYYPAPVPVMLNLPVRLSKLNWGEREKKRLQALGDMPEDMRKSAPWLASEEVSTPANRQSTLKLPPQLRASAYFDHRGTEMNVQLKNGSAVATLDSILDAAAHAPVSAFTDHPIVGHLGKEVYGPSTAKKGLQVPHDKAKRKSSAKTLLHSGEAVSPNGLVDDEHAKSEVRDNGSEAAADSEEDDDASEEEVESESEEDTRDPGFSKAPTTLLAELQMRKAQQKQRNRTAADAFPNGMHSTLLELDTVTQLQQKARKQKHITLAWEDHDEADRENFDDDDVPLGVLFPDKDRNEAANVNRPLGLMEKRELEENEPLSFRRARLRGEPLMPPEAAKSPSNMDDAPRIEDPELDENPHETLGQRMKRLRDKRENGSTSDFAREVHSELGLSVPNPQPPKTKTPDPEETLGQRRRRLKDEAAHHGGGNGLLSPPLGKAGSMADLLRSNPVQYLHPNEGKTAAGAMQSYQQQMQRDPAFLAQQQAAAVMGQGFAQPTAFKMGIANPYMNGHYGQMNPAFLANMAKHPMAAYGTPMAMGMGMGVGMNGGQFPYGMQGYGNPAAGFDMGPPLNAKQRATIDQWRQGIA